MSIPVESAKKRLNVLSRQLTTLTSSNNVEATIKESPCADDQGILNLAKRVVVAADKCDQNVKRELVELLQSEPELFKIDQLDLTMAEKRELIMKQLRFLGKRKMLQCEEVRSKPLRYFSGAETLNLFDPTLAIKSGVHFALFGGAVHSLGTEKHKKYLELANDLKILCSFSLTELGHGSNARAVETTATYDQKTDEFIIHSPSVMAQKYYIGGSVHGTHTVVFAQMLIGDKYHGVQGFVVPLRDQNGNIFPSIRIKDCGHKMGLQGVDNGRIMFEHHRIPRDNLLDKYGYVTREGQYVTEIESNAARFATMIGALVYGRVGLIMGSVSVSKLALIIAIKYSAERLQFGPPGKPEIPILDYLSQQRRLFPLLSKTYAMHFAMRKVLDQLQSNDQKKLHILAAGLKALATWHVNETLSTARQCTGGQGYLSENRLGELKACLEIYTTFEGDNVVLLQQVAASNLKEFRDQFKKGKIYSGIFNYVADEVTVRVKERNPAQKRNTFKDHLLSSSFHHHALRFRKKRLTAMLASQLRTLTKTKEFFDAWNDSLDLALAAAIAHIEYTVYKAFSSHLSEILETIKGKPGALQTKDLFKRVKKMYAVSTIQQNSGFFLEEHYFAASKAKALTRQLNELCAAIRPDATLLCDAFDIPEMFIPPLGKSSWIEHNKF